jgi:hypothetical protein
VRAIGAASLFPNGCSAVLFTSLHLMLDSAQRSTYPAPDAVPSAESMLSIYLINGATAPLVPGLPAVYG